MSSTAGHCTLSRAHALRSAAINAPAVLTVKVEVLQLRHLAQCWGQACCSGLPKLVACHAHTHGLSTHSRHVSHHHTVITAPSRQQSATNQSPQVAHRNTNHNLNPNPNPPPCQSGAPSMYEAKHTSHSPQHNDQHKAMPHGHPEPKTAATTAIAALRVATFNTHAPSHTAE